MPTIHINTDLMHQLGKLFTTLNEQIQNQIEPQIQNLTSQIEGDWQGQSRLTYNNLYNDWYTNIKLVVQHGEDLGTHLQNTATQFEQADRSL